MLTKFEPQISENLKNLKHGSLHKYFCWPYDLL